MSFFRDCKEKPFGSKGRMYYDGLKQRIDNLKKYVLEEDEKPVNLSYNLYKTLLRLKELREVFFNHTLSEPKYFLKDVSENDIRDAIRDKFLTLHEVTDDIALLESYVIQIMQKTLNHLHILPIMQEIEFVKSDNEEYLTDLYANSLNHTVLVNCEKYILVLSDSKEKSELLSTLDYLKNKVIAHAQKPFVEDVELSDDATTDDELETASYDWLEDEDLKSKTIDEKKFTPVDLSKSVEESDSIILDDSLRWSQFPFEKSNIIDAKPEEKKVITPSPPLPPVAVDHPYTIWYKVGIILSSSILSSLGGLVVSIFFTGGLALPILMGVGAVMGFLLGLKIISSKEGANTLIHSKPLEVSCSI